MDFILRSIRRFLLIFEWLLTSAFRTIRCRLPFWKVKPIAKIFNTVNFPHQSSNGTVSRGIWINGRVLSERKTIPPTKKDSRWLNFRRMTSQWLTREIPNTGVTIRIGGQEHKLKSDKEGYFQLTAHEITGSIHVSLDEFSYSSKIEAQGVCVIPKYVIITDVDDTLLETGAVSLAKMLKTTLLSNALTREIVSGMPDIINELSLDGINPVFYVTSSPWNLHSFLGRVFTRAKLPTGGIFMTDWGLTPTQWITPSHHKHKGEALNRIYNWFSDSQILLFGDDSQKDHRIYAGFIRMHPTKVKAAFIRNISGTQKRRQVEKIIKKLHTEIGREVIYIVTDSQEIRGILERLKL